VIRLRLLSKDEYQRVEYDGTPPTIEIRYGSQDRRAVLEQWIRSLESWEPISVEYTVL
jgi:hypothetical protein